LAENFNIPLFLLDFSRLDLKKISPRLFNINATHHEYYFSGRRDCVLVSHDWGAVISWYFVMSNPQLVSKYIMLNLPHPEVIQNNMSIKQFFKSWSVIPNF